MTLKRLCSECGEPLTGSKTQKTCSEKCRSARHRRVKRERAREKEGAVNPRRVVDRMGENHIADIAKEVAREQLRPVVREALNDEVMQAVKDMVGLTPLAVAAMTEDLMSEDPKIRQAAYTVLMKYTIGHPAVGPKPEQESQQLVVNIGLPRPSSGSQVLDELVEAEADEFKTCDMCELEKPASEFVDGSDRCSDCFNQQREEALKLLG